VRAAPTTVFDAFFREPTRWLCRKASVDLQVGGHVHMCWSDGCYEGRFVQCAPPTLARFSWAIPEIELPETMVVVHTDPGAGPDETALELEHYGFGVGADWDAMYVGAARAWSGYLKNLRAVLEMGIDLREVDE
jgi:uncharacterized protein YndB with AHSA1/START domain